MFRIRSQVMIAMAKLSCLTSLVLFLVEFPIPNKWGNEDSFCLPYLAYPISLSTVTTTSLSFLFLSHKHWSHLIRDCRIPPTYFEPNFSYSCLAQVFPPKREDEERTSTFDPTLSHLAPLPSLSQVFNFVN